MSEELGVRSEEFIPLLRGCASGSSEFCRSCKLRGYSHCYDVLMAAAADELERLNKERKYLLKIADSADCTCGSCRHGVMAGKPCPSIDDINDCEDCGKCICGECRDGDKWELDGKKL